MPATHPLAAAAHDQAAAFLEARRAQHLDFRMEGDAGDGAPAGGGEGAGTGEPNAAGEPGADTAPKTLEEALAEVSKWKAMSRKHEGTSRANADKARQFDELQEANKTELQKAADRAAAAEAKAADVEARALRAEVAADKGIPAALLSGSTKEELEASADALLAFRGPATRSATAQEAGAGQQGEPIGAPKQLTRDDLKSMTPAQILAAQKAGQLKTLTQGA